MRQFYLVLLACFCSVSLGAQTLQSSKTDSAVLKFTHKEFEFSKILESGGVVTHNFEFTNNGNIPLVIVRVVTSCTCTKAKFAKKPVAPGAKSLIEIEYDPRKQKGVFYKAIQVYSNSGDGREIITIKGEVLDK